MCTSVPLHKQISGDLAPGNACLTLSPPACSPPRTLTCHHTPSPYSPRAFLSAEPALGSSLVVSLFEVACTGDAIPAFIEREHEFRFMAVSPTELHSEKSIGAPSLLCV